MKTILRTLTFAVTAAVLLVLFWIADRVAYRRP